MNRLRIALVTLGAVGIMAGGGAAIANAASSKLRVDDHAEHRHDDHAVAGQQLEHPQLSEHVGRTARETTQSTFTYATRRRRKPASRFFTFSHSS